MSQIRILRLENDALDLEAWLSRGGSRYAQVLEREGRPPTRWRLRLEVPGVVGASTVHLEENRPGHRSLGPLRIREHHQVRITIPEDYPLRPPVVHFEEGLFHPNVFASGRLCWGIAESDASWWRGGEGLGLLVERLLAIVVGSRECTNLRSPAELRAVSVYAENAGLFPLATVIVPGEPEKKAAPRQDPQERSVRFTVRSEDHA